MQPEVIVETETFHGGLSIYLATVLQHVNPLGRILTVDIDGKNWRATVTSGKVPQDLLKMITFFESDSISFALTKEIERLTSKEGNPCDSGLSSLL